jgi:hypothetical protein
MVESAKFQTSHLQLLENSCLGFTTPATYKTTGLMFGHVFWQQIWKNKHEDIVYTTILCKQATFCSLKSFTTLYLPQKQ